MRFYYFLQMLYIQTYILFQNQILIQQFEHQHPKDMNFQEIVDVEDRLFDFAVGVEAQGLHRLAHVGQAGGDGNAGDSVIDTLEMLGDTGFRG